jgi:hypothetical protein
MATLSSCNCRLLMPPWEIAAAESLWMEMAKSTDPFDALDRHIDLRLPQFHPLNVEVPANRSGMMGISHFLNTSTLTPFLT